MRAPWANAGASGAGVPEAPMRAPWAAKPQAPRCGAAPAPPSTFQWRGWSFTAPKGPILSTHDADK